MKNRFNATFRALMVGVITGTLLLACEKESITSEEASAAEAARLSLAGDSTGTIPDSLCNKGGHPKGGKHHSGDSLRSDSLHFHPKPWPGDSTKVRPYPADSVRHDTLHPHPRHGR